MARTPSTASVTATMTRNLVSGIRTRKDIILRTSRANPGRQVSERRDLADPAKLEAARAIAVAGHAIGSSGETGRKWYLVVGTEMLQFTECTCVEEYDVEPGQ